MRVDTLSASVCRTGRELECQGTLDSTPREYLHAGIGSVADCRTCHRRCVCLFSGIDNAFADDRIRFLVRVLGRVCAVMAR